MKKLLLILALAGTISAQAQLLDDKNQFNHLSVGLSLGTTGIGLEVGTLICPYVGVRAGVDFMPKVSVSNHFDYDRPAVLNNVNGELLETRYINIPEYGASVDIKGKLYKTQGKLMFDIYPGKNTMFHFTVGATFGSSVLASIRATDRAIAAIELYNRDIKNGLIVPEPNYPDGFSVDLEGYRLTPNEGRIRLDAKVNGFRPYLGFGVGRTVPRKRVGCKFEMGVEFWGKVRVVDAYANGGDGHIISEDEPGISDDFKDVVKIINKVPVYPTLKLTIFGRIF